MGKRLGILVLTDECSGDLEFIQGLCSAAKETDAEVEVFFMADGVRHLRDPLVRSIREAASTCFCALNAMERGLDGEREYPWGMNEGSQYDLACIAERSDRLLALT